MTREALGIASIGLSIHDEVVLRSLLSIIRGKTSVHWQLVPEAEADLLLVATHALPSVSAAERRPLLCLEPAIAASTGLRGDHLALHAPLRVMPLMFALNRAADKLVLPPTRAVRAVAEVTTPATMAHALHPLTAALMKAPRSAITRLAAADGEPLIRVDWRNARYISVEPLDALWQRCTDAGEVMLRQEQSFPPAVTPRPLAELLLHAGRHATLNGSPQLLPPMRTDEHFQISRWPDAAVLREDSDFVRLCGMLSRRALTLRESAATSRLGEARVIAFFNLMALLGLMRQITAPANAPSGSVTRRGGVSSQLVSMIRRCLHVGSMPASTVRPS